MHHNKSFRQFFIFAVILVILTGCTPAADTAEAMPEEGLEASEDAQSKLVFSDDLGNTLEFDDYPQAIVSLSPSTTEILFAVGAGSQVAGRDEMSLYPEEAALVPSVGAMWGDLPAEAILAAEPDVVIVAEIISEDTVRALQELGLQVYWQANPDSFEDLYQNLLDIASLTGHVSEAEALIPALKERVESVETAVSGAGKVPSVFYELDATDPANPWTAGAGTFIDYVINLAGGTNAAGMLKGEYAQISSEVLIEINPDVIVLADAPFGVSPESVVDRAGWDIIAAVQNGDVYPFNPDILSVPGPRLVDGLEAMARLLHHDLFASE